MSDHFDEPHADANASSTASDARLQRRRMLVSALGKGGAVLAASVPLAANAIPATGTVLVTNPGGTNNRRCTISGVGSVVASNVPNGVACGAKSVQSYIDATAWPSPYRKVAGGGGPATSANTLLATSAFPNNGANSTALAVLQAGGMNAVWVAAALNSVEPSPNTFPYTLGEVQAHFADRNNPAVDRFYRVLFGIP